MADWDFCTSGSAVFHAGVHCNAISGSAVFMLQSYRNAQGRIEQETKTDWTTNYSTLPTGIKYQLSNVCSRIIAMDIIKYDSTGYLIREANMIMNANYDAIKEGMAELTNSTKHSLLSP